MAELTLIYTTDPAAVWKTKTGAEEDPISIVSVGYQTPSVR